MFNRCIYINQDNKQHTNLNNNYYFNDHSQTSLSDDQIQHMVMLLKPYVLFEEYLKGFTNTGQSQTSISDEQIQQMVMLLKPYGLFKEYLKGLRNTGQCQPLFSDDQIQQIVILLKPYGLF